jgi:hypothetical protein
MTPAGRQALPLKIYVASSWRNTFQPDVVAALREDGHEVYDFKDSDGFHWTEVDGGWQSWPDDIPKYLAGLNHPCALRGFNRDMTALKNCDVCVYVMPCGVSASLEAGWAVGAGKRVVVYVPGLREPDLMVKMAHLVTDKLDMVRVFVGKSAGLAAEASALPLQEKEQEASTQPDKCPTCGAPTLKPGERHAKVLLPRPRPPFYFEPDEEAGSRVDRPAVAPQSAGAIIIRKVDEWASHVRSCAADDDCPVCQAAMNQLVLAHSVWQASHKPFEEAAPQALGWQPPQQLTPEQNARILHAMMDVESALKDQRLIIADFIDARGDKKLAQEIRLEVYLLPPVAPDPPQEKP